MRGNEILASRHMQGKRFGLLHQLFLEGPLVLSAHTGVRENTHLLDVFQLKYAFVLSWHLNDAPQHFARTGEA